MPDGKGTCRPGLSFRGAVFESLDSLRQSGLRSLFALLGIAVGCAAVTALLNIGHSAANEATDTFKRLGTNTLVVSFSPLSGSVGPSAVAPDWKALTVELTEIEFVAPVVMHSARIRHAGRDTDVSIVGTTQDLAPVMGLRADRGRLLSDFDRCSTYVVVGAGVARGLALELGSRLQVAGYLLEVIGILANQPFNPLLPVDVDESVFLPIEGIRRMRPAPGIGNVIVQAHDTADLAQTASTLKRYLDRASRGYQVDVQVPRQLLEALSRQANTFAYLLAGVGGIALLVGGVGVMNVMLMGVRERRREIGVRMALGARASDIRNLFLAEAAGLCLSGSTLGAIGGLLFAYAFVCFSGWTFRMSPVSLPLGISSSLAIGLFFGSYPALLAARLRPVQALRDD
ncbi:putative ABC transport system permease protein [Pseudomonas citronellolis]|uniref:ABC transport system permease protein n=1 Tax=Pseudomonas citronellolis TaxID=53408 RepID=A0AAQ1KEL2_9PSED|nr:ABC transporter permease [Pseudomonas citronellolis]TGC27899.1 ABC transporter permease [Pseudomonas citronellolis]SFC42444.1 putative ABC transport system permease protein [Pseudomonas citronellolis]